MCGDFYCVNWAVFFLIYLLLLLLLFFFFFFIIIIIIIIIIFFFLGGAQTSAKEYKAQSPNTRALEALGGGGGGVDALSYCLSLICKHSDTKWDLKYTVN